MKICVFCYVLLLAVSFHGSTTNSGQGELQKEKFLFPLLGVQSYQKFPFVKHGVAQSVALCALSASWNLAFSNFLGLPSSLYFVME